MKDEDKTLSQLAQEYESWDVSFQTSKIEFASVETRMRGAETRLSQLRRLIMERIAAS